MKMGHFLADTSPASAEVSDVDWEVADFGTGMAFWAVLSPGWDPCEIAEPSPEQWLAASAGWDTQVGSSSLLRDPDWFLSKNVLCVYRAIVAVDK